MSSTIPLPPWPLRRGSGDQRRDDATFITSASELVQSIGALWNVAEDSAAKGSDESIVVFETAVLEDTMFSRHLSGRTILDLGSGPMRLLTGLRKLDIPYREYVGIDVNADCIEWARKNCNFGKERFIAINIKNERYNPDGENLEGFKLPLDSSSCDLIVLRSVFTHMRLSDIEVYLSELSRVVRPKGYIYLSVYVADEGPLEIENPSDFMGGTTRYNGPLHRVVLNREHFEHLVQSAGLKIRVFCPQLFNQQTYLLST